MKLIIGLGNPEKEYENTRHNAGFLCVDFLQKELGFGPFALDKKMSAEISSGMLSGEKVLCVKPTTFMNHSGTAAQALVRFYKLAPADIAVIHDDLDISSGEYKTAISSRAAGHNGVQDIIERLGTQDFFRIRLGIGRPQAEPRPEPGRPASDTGACISTHDYVLQPFSPEELTQLQELFPKVKMLLLDRLNTSQ
ncbi:MAG: aminoacyl-tRNA hydrolase [Candidatus Moraniibacteriota bacterium]